MFTCHPQSHCKQTLFLQQYIVSRAKDTLLRIKNESHGCVWACALLQLACTVTFVVDRQLNAQSQSLLPAKMLKVMEGPARLVCWVSVCWLPGKQTGHLRLPGRCPGRSLGCAIGGTATSTSSTALYTHSASNTLRRIKTRSSGTPCVFFQSSFLESWKTRTGCWFRPGGLPSARWPVSLGGQLTSSDGLSSKFSLWKPPLHRYTQTEKTSISRLAGKDERQQEGKKSLPPCLKLKRKGVHFTCRSD